MTVTLGIQEKLGRGPGLGTSVREGRRAGHRNGEASDQASEDACAAPSLVPRSQAATLLPSLPEVKGLVPP